MCPWCCRVTPTTFADCNAVVAWSAAAQVVVSSQVRMRRNCLPAGDTGESVDLAVPGRARQLHRRPAVRDLREPDMNQRPLAGYAPAPVGRPHGEPRHHMLKVAMADR